METVTGIVSGSNQPRVFRTDWHEKRPREVSPLIVVAIKSKKRATKDDDNDTKQRDITTTTQNDEHIKKEQL